jgi:hypothetical protein
VQLEDIEDDLRDFWYRRGLGRQRRRFQASSNLLQAVDEAPSVFV